MFIVLRFCVFNLVTISKSLSFILVKCSSVYIYFHCLAVISSQLNEEENSTVAHVVEGYKEEGHGPDK